MWGEAVREKSLAVSPLEVGWLSLCRSHGLGSHAATMGRDVAGALLGGGGGGAVGAKGERCGCTALHAACFGGHLVATHRPTRNYDAINGV